MEKTQGLTIIGLRDHMKELFMIDIYKDVLRQYRTA